MYIAASARWLCFLTWICAIAHPALGKDAPTVIAGMDSLRQSVNSAQAVFDAYDGGWLSSWELGRAVWDVYAQTKSARGQWDSAPAFEEEQVPDILVAYHSMRQSVADALGAAGSKGSMYDKSGVRLMAIAIMQLFENERSSFQEAARAKIPEAFHDDIAGPVANLGNEFQSAMKALA